MSAPSTLRFLRTLACLPVVAMGVLAIGCAGSADDRSVDDGTASAEQTLRKNQDGCDAHFTSNPGELPSHNHGRILPTRTRGIYALSLFFDGDGDHNNAVVWVKHPGGTTNTWHTGDNVPNRKWTNVRTFRAEPGAIVSVKMIPDFSDVSDPHCGLRMQITN